MKKTYVILSINPYIFLRVQRNAAVNTSSLISCGSFAFRSGPKRDIHFSLNWKISFIIQNWLFHTSDFFMSSLYYRQKDFWIFNRFWTCNKYYSKLILTWYINPQLIFITAYSLSLIRSVIDNWVYRF